MTVPVDYEDEARLIAQAKEDAEAFGALYERYVERIYNYVYYRVGNQQDAEDLVARVFYRALANIDNYEDRGVPFSAWLYRIAHNLVANWHRDRSRRNIVPLDDLIIAGAVDGMPEAVAESQEEHARLIEAVRRLSPDRQQVLILKFVERLSNVEIGGIMDRTEGAVKSLYHRTLITLRDALTLPAAEPKKKRRWFGLRRTRSK
ncbi:MAG: sigma-70 family RNA polymerase sigma factor [Anaerolineae bacterium]|nr:sigma-70 family RNA polymerase sigma factor [Anaerolineae bacterium]